MSRLKFRRKEKKYTEVYNTIIFKNKNVELTGLYTTIQACIDLEINTAGTDNEFTVSKKTLQSFTGYKHDKFQRIWNELKQSGYLKQYKIKSDSGKFEYEYELLDEPDLTKHHSLVVKDCGSIVPNIPKIKIDKLINKPEVENTPLEPGGEKPHCGEMGDYYNNSLDKVCMYVCIAKENFALTNKNIEYINSIKEKIEYNLFEQIIVDAKNKNKTFSYVVGTIDKSITKGITTLDVFLDNRKKYKTNKNSNTTAPKVRTRFHNVTNNTKNYTPEALEKLLQENQKDKFECDKVLNNYEDANKDTNKESEVKNNEGKNENKFNPSFSV